MNSEVAEVVARSRTGSAHHRSMSTETGNRAKIGVSLQKLTKIFPMSGSDLRVAVNELSVDFNVGEVTALLGHNGAGKSTIM